MEGGWIGLATGSTIVLRGCSTEKGKSVLLVGHSGEVTCLVYDRKGSRLFSGSSGNKSRPEIIEWRI